MISATIERPSFTPGEEVNLRRRLNLKPSEWASANRYLPPQMTASPGMWRNELTPYLVGIMDAVCEEGIEDIVFLKPTQVGFSESLRNTIGYWIDNDPGPTLLVMPSDQSGREMVGERIRPLINFSPALKRHLSGKPWDDTLGAIKLDTMSLFLGTAGSPQSLASRPCRYVVFDEIDKYPPFSGREADPISLGTERTATFGYRRRIIKGSTPTTREGAIWKAWQSCGDQRHYQVPCPHEDCGKYQRLVWPRVKWPKLDITDKIQRADEIERNRLAWYECEHCGKKIEESHKREMLSRGRWVSTTQAVDRDGTVHGERPVTKRVGFHLNSLYSPWRTLWEMAAEFIRAEGDAPATMNFRNSRLAEPFEVQITKHEPSLIREKSEQAKTLGKAGEIRVVPDWAVLFIATCDVQKDHCYWDVSCWGYELKSKRVAVGVAATLDEVYRHVFTPDVPFVAEQGGVVYVSELIVDSGYRKDEVTDFARRDPQRVRMYKGLSEYFGPIAAEKVEKASGVVVWNVNTMQSKDTLSRLINDPDPLKWQVFAGVTDEYCAQLASEHKILDPHKRIEVWAKKSSGAPNHFWDCGAMSAAIAAAKGAGMPAPTFQSDAQTAAQTVVSKVPGWMTKNRPNR